MTPPKTELLPTPRVDAAEYDTVNGVIVTPYVDSEFARTLEQELAEVKALAEEMAKALECIQQRWTFNNSQQHTHSWHDWADCQPMITSALASYRANQPKP